MTCARKAGTNWLLLAYCVSAITMSLPAWAAQPVDAEESAEPTDSKELPEQTETPEPVAEVTSALSEDPETQRRELMVSDPTDRLTWPKIQLYGSVRLHAINHFNEEKEQTDVRLGDGASRAGVRGEWQMGKNSWLFGRGEMGFNILDTFTPKADSKEDDSNDVNVRLAYVGFDSKYLQFTYGKNWSSYYQIAGMADQYSIFGGSAAGVYNAGTDGGATGTGRADDVLQARVYTSSLKRLNIKPFNLNLQYQYDQPIPKVQGRRYGKSWGASAWLETFSEKGIGLA